MTIDTMKTISLDELTNKYIGEKGTPKRDRFETNYDWIY